jgi:putative ABC transport system permease protein
MLESLNIVTYVLIVSAGLLAFIVLYNLSNININERKRELASLKVLGFYDGEVNSYVMRENILLTFIGIGVGVLLGKVLHGFVIKTCEIDAVMFGRIIMPMSYVVSGILTLGFSLLICFFMYFKLKKIDMIESLKSVE